MHPEYFKNYIVSLLLYSQQFSEVINDVRTADTVVAHVCYEIHTINQIVNLLSFLPVAPPVMQTKIN
jgi:hypothetical protein